MFCLTLASPFFPPATTVACRRWKWGAGLPFLEVKALQFLLESEALSAARDGFAMETCCAMCVLNSLEDEQSC